MTEARSRVPVAAVALWLVATLLVAVAPLLYFAAGSSDAVAEGTRVGYATVPLVVAAAPLAGALALLRRRPTGSRSALGPAVQHAAVLLLIAAALLAVGRWLATSGSIHGDGQWAAYWLICTAGWLGLGWASAERVARG